MNDGLRATALSSHVTRIIVPTPTLPPAFHTNCYLIEDGGEGLLVDFGTNDAETLQATARLLRGRRITKWTIAATHYHRDHTHGLPRIAAYLDAPIYVHAMDLPAAAQEMNVSATTLQPIPSAFEVGKVRVLVHHLPGHTHGHVHLEVQPDGVLLVGDHLAGTGSVWIGPPDGHLDDYLDALDAIAASGCRIAAPGHGDALNPAADAANALKQRRLMREQQIMAHLVQGQSRAQLVDAIYGDTVPEKARFAADRTVQGHLDRLIEAGQATKVWDDAAKCFMYKTITNH